MEESNSIVYSIGRDDGEYRFKHGANQDMRYLNFVSYTMKSGNRYRLGDSVRIDGKTYIVMEKRVAYEQGVIQEYYVLGSEELFAVPFYHNRRIAGLELEGEVMDRIEQDLYILLDIDAERKDCGKTWFSYSPATNNGMYSMPLEGEKVMLQWQSEADDDILVIRPDRKNSDDMPHYGQRHFLADCENHLMMIPDTVEWTNPVGSMKWLVGKGFDLSTVKHVVIAAEQDIVVTSQAQIQVFSPERITTCKAGVESSIDMVSNELHIKAVKKVNTASQANNYKKSKLPERTQPFEISASVASKLEAAICVSTN